MLRSKGSSNSSTCPATRSSERSLRLTPIEQQRAAAHPRDRSRQRHLLVEVEDARRVDQRRDEHAPAARSPP